MTFRWPFVLLSLLLVPLLLAAYVWQTRRRRRTAVRHSSVALIRAAAPGSAWRRHVPVAAMLAMLACLALAGARPQARTDVPAAGAAVILALDVSGSMCATDVDPNRLTAAQTAVRDFVKRQDGSTRIGLVVFSGFAQLAVAPTTDRVGLLRAIDSLTTGRGTTIGAAILKSVDAIAQINPNVAPADPGGSTGAAASPDAAPSAATSGTSSPDGAVGGGQSLRNEVPIAPEIVVLLTDGANTGGIAPLAAARIAADRGVRVYPIGFGTTNPTSMVCTAQQLGGTQFDNPRGGFGGGFGGGGQSGRNFLVADEPTLRQVAAITGGTYFSARGAGQLQGVLTDLPRHVVVQKQTIELTVLFAGLAVLLLLGAVGAAVRWTTFPG